MSKRSKRNASMESVLDDQVVETLAEAIAPIDPPLARTAGLRKRVLRHTRASQTIGKSELLTIRAHEGWKTIAPGVEMKDLYVDHVSHTRSFLLRMQPGASMPEHDHAGDEECVMLEGEASLGGIALRAGDYHVAPKGALHGVLSTQTGAMLYVRAALADLERVGLR